MQDINSSTHTSLSFVNLALALANDYSTLFVIDSENDSYIEYSPIGAEKELIPVSRGDDFYAAVPHNTREQVWKDDQEFFMKAFQKENVINALKDGHAFTLNYRLRVNGTPRYFFLKAIRATDKSIVIGVRDIDEQRRRELKNEEASRTYSKIASSLASRYEVIYYIDTDTDEYIQYSSSEEYAKLGTTKKGDDFFRDAENDIREYIHPDDMHRILSQLRKDTLMGNLRKKGSLSLSYRQFLDGRQQHVNMLLVHPRNDVHHIVMGVFNIEEQYSREQSIREEGQTFSDMAMALARRYEVIYRVNIITDEYVEYNASDQYAKLKIGAKGKDFFSETQINMKKDIYHEDLPMMSVSMQKDNLLNSLDSSGKTVLNYRLMLDGRAQYVSLYAVRPTDDSDHIIIAVANVDAAKRMELAYQNAVDMANRDALTGVKNKRAYVQAEMDLDEQLTNHVRPEFSIVVCDVNGLKTVNDTKGHNEGDDFICRSCGIICGIFKHSPVFRIGGDEFAAILRGQDYEHRQMLMEQFQSALDNDLYDGVPMLAVGMSDFDPAYDLRVQDVFERADALMYKNKESRKRK